MSSIQGPAVFWYRPSLYAAVTCGLVLLRCAARRDTVVACGRLDVVIRCCRLHASVRTPTARQAAKAGRRVDTLT